MNVKTSTSFFEQQQKRLHIVFVGGYGDIVNIASVECLQEVVLSFCPVAGVSCSQLLAAGVDILFKSCFRIHHLHKSHVRHLFGASVINLYCHDVVFSVAYDERLLKVLPYIKVAEHESGASAFADTGEQLQCLLYVSLTTFGMELEHLPYDVEDVLSSLFFLFLFLYFV